MDSNTLISKIKQNNPLDFGDIFSKSFDLFKKTWLHGFLFLILSIVLIIPAVLIIYIPVLGMVGYEDYSRHEHGILPEIPWVAMIPFFFLFIIVLIFINTVVFAMNAGFYNIIKKIDAGKEASTGDLFMYVKGPYLVKAFIISLMTIGISLLALLLCYLPIFYVMVPIYFTAVVFAFNPELTPSEVIKVSFSIGNKKWLIAFGLIIVSSVLSELVGLLLCGIGVLFTVSFVYLPVYFMYKQVVGFDNNQDAKMEQFATQ